MASGFSGIIITPSTINRNTYSPGNWEGDPYISNKVFFMIDSQSTPIGEYFLTGYAICTLEQLSETRFFEKEARFFGFSRF